MHSRFCGLGLLAASGCVGDLSADAPPCMVSAGETAGAELWRAERLAEPRPASPCAIGVAGAWDVEVETTHGGVRSSSSRHYEVDASGTTITRTTSTGGQIVWWRDEGETEFLSTEDEDRDGIPERARRTSIDYDSEGRRALCTTDLDGDGLADEVRTYHFDRAIERVDVDWEADGDVDAVTETVRDEHGRELSIRQRTGDWVATDVCEYDDLSSTATCESFDGTGILQSRSVEHFTLDGSLARFESDDNADGSVDLEVVVRTADGGDVWVEWRFLTERHFTFGGRAGFEDESVPLATPVVRFDHSTYDEAGRLVVDEYIDSSGVVSSRTTYRYACSA